MSDALYVYTGLTEAQYMDLRDAARGKLTAMNGARHQAMIELIDENLMITDFGKSVFLRAVNRMSGILPTPWIDEVPTFNALRFKKYLQQNLGGMTYTTAHAKLIYSLATHPEQSYNVLVDGYGTKTIDELAGRCLIAGTPRKYHYYSLTGIALNWLKWFLEEQTK